MQATVHSSRTIRADGIAVQTSERSRNATIDLLKGLAIILVVAGHYYPPDSPDWWTLVHNLIYAFHMPAFFFGAGYIWHLRPREGYGSYLARKVRRLLVPCLSVIVLYIPVKLAASLLTDLGHPVTVATLAKVVTDPTHSFLPFVWFFYVLFAVCAIFPVVHRGGPGVVWLSLAPAATLYLRGENHYLIMTSMGYLYFTAGALFAGYFRLDLDRHISGRVMELTLACGTLFVAIALLWKPGYGWSAQPRHLFVSVLGTTTAILACQAVAARHHGNRRDGGSARPRVISGSLMRVGVSSMTVCLFHTLFVGTAKAGLDRLASQADPAFALKAVPCILAGVLLPLGLERAVLDRVKILRVLFLSETGTMPKRRRFDPAVARARLKASWGSPAGFHTHRY